MSLPTVTVGFYLRERFSATGESLRSIVKNTKMPFNLVIVDCNAPPRYRAEMEAAVHHLRGVTWINRKEFVHVNVSRNLIAAANDSKYICFIENAAVVSPGWLEALVEACEPYERVAATPRLMERTWRGVIPHHDRGFVDMHATEKHGVTARVLIANDARRAWRFKEAEVSIVKTMEGHVNFFSRSAWNAIGPLDESLTAATHVDMSCALHAMGIPLLNVPKSVVTHLSTSWLLEEDFDFYRFRWDVARAKASRNAIQKRWNIKNMTDVEYFAAGQLRRTNPIQWRLYWLSQLPKTVRQRFSTSTETA